MSDELEASASASIHDDVREIFDCALAETLTRLTTITPKEREDNRAFDRVARTALAFLRVAEGAVSLAARKRKEQTEDDKDGANAEHAARLKRDEEILKRELNAHIDRLTGRGASGAGCGDVAQDGAGRGDRS